MPEKLNSQALPDRIPVYFLSGFLGSGKSTLLNELLSDPSFHDTAVIINEFGDVAVDHLLVRRGETAIAQVATGCLCCAGGTDIRATLFDLHCAASNGLAPQFSRVIVEMSGLGDPAPLISALMPDQHETDTLRDRTIDNTFYLAGFNTLYDIVSGDISIERYFEAMKQVAFADRIVLTKTDLAKDPATIADIAALPNQLRMLNASAEIVDRQNMRLSELFAPRMYSAIDQGDEVVGWLALEAVLAAEESRHNTKDSSQTVQTRHGNGVQTFSLVRDQPISFDQFSNFLSLLQEYAGPRLLRVKGLIGLEEEPEKPYVIHAVQQAISKPVVLERWPDEDRSSRVVFITDGIEAEPVRKLFEAVIDDRFKSTGALKEGVATKLRGSRSRVSKFFGALTQGVS